MLTIIKGAESGVGRQSTTGPALLRDLPVNVDKYIYYSGDSTYVYLIINYNTF